MKYKYLENAYGAFLLQGRVNGFKNHIKNAEKEIDDIEKHIDILKKGPFNGLEPQVICEKHKVIYYKHIEDWMILPCCRVKNLTNSLLNVEDK